MATRPSLRLARRAALALALSTLPLAFAGSGAAAEPFTLQDLLAVDSIGFPKLSPDGETVALVIRDQIALLPSGGGWPRALTTTAGGKSYLAWSPDSRHIAYASQASIWTVPREGGAPTRLTDAAAGAGDPRVSGDRLPSWSPDGAWILFVSGRRGQLDLLLVSADGQADSALTSSDDVDEYEAVWSPTGDRVAFVERSKDGFFTGRLRVMEVDPGAKAPAGESRLLYTAPEDAGGGWRLPRPAWSPDGQSLAVVLQRSGWDNVYLIPAGGGEPRALTQGSWEDSPYSETLSTPVFSPDGSELAIVSNRGNLESRFVWLVPLDGTAPRRLTDRATGSELRPQFSPDGRRVFFRLSGPLVSPDFASAATTGASTPERLTRTLPLAFEKAGLTEPEVVRWQGEDGLEIAGMLFKPPGWQAGSPGPAVLWIHGGPEDQADFSWNVTPLLLAQEGYVVLLPNYRGSRGYGEEFRNLNVADSGGGELDDVVAGARFLVTEGLADANRLALAGGSHGGTMVAYAVTKVPELFRAAVDLYGVTDRGTYLERTNRHSAERWTRKMGGPPAERPEVYRRANTILDVEKVETPLLILHGEDDPQVPLYESAQFAEALERAGKTVTYVTYPGEGHGFSRPDHRIDAWTRMLAFLSRHLAAG